VNDQFHATTCVTNNRFCASNPEVMLLAPNLIPALAYQSGLTIASSFCRLYALRPAYSQIGVRSFAIDIF
jgi:hypothetical protein